MPLLLGDQPFSVGTSGYLPWTCGEGEARPGLLGDSARSVADAHRDVPLRS